MCMKSYHGNSVKNYYNRKMNKMIFSFIFLSGCSKCLKEFPRDETNKPNYSSYHENDFPLRAALTIEELLLIF